MRYEGWFPIALLLLVAPAAVQCQPVAGEGYISVAQGRLFRIGDKPVDSGPNVGAGIGLLHRSGLGLDLEYNRTLGLSAPSAPCGIVNVPCEDSARDGVTSADILSLNVRYEFTRARVRPYVTGGVGALRFKGYSSILSASPQRAVFSEEQWTDNGLAFNVGGGLRIRITNRLFLRPELRIYNGVALSRANLSMFRPSLVLGFSW